MTKPIRLPVLAALAFFLVAAACACASGKGDKDKGGEISLSALERESLAVLTAYLADKRPDVASLAAESVVSADKKGSHVELICSYEERGKSLWLKAWLTREKSGTLRVVKILFAYEYDRRKKP